MSEDAPDAGTDPDSHSVPEPDGGVPADAEAAGEADESEGYGGVFGAFPYAFGASDSRLFRSYVVLGGLLAALVTVVFVFALVQLVANTVGTAGGTFSFVRAFYIFVGFLVVAPLLGPVLLVARRHRRSVSTPEYDGALAASGYLFVLSLYLALVVTAPEANRETPPALVAPVVDFLYGLPPAAGAVPPLGAVLLGYLVHRHYR
jgi:hypothetical protein